jgi:hypothetical protein
VLNAVIASFAEVHAAISVVVSWLHMRLVWQIEAEGLVANRMAIRRGCQIARKKGHIVEIGLHNVPAEFLILKIVGTNRIFSVKPNG